MEHNHHKTSQENAMSCGSAQDFLRRFWIVTFLLIPLIFTNEMIAIRKMDWVGYRDGNFQFLTHILPTCVA